MDVDIERKIREVKQNTRKKSYPRLNLVSDLMINYDQTNCVETDEQWLCNAAQVNFNNEQGRLFFN